MRLLAQEVLQVGVVALGQELQESEVPNTLQHCLRLAGGRLGRVGALLATRALFLFRIFVVLLH